MKYALITSSTNGIGKAIGKSLLREGYFVFFNYSKNEENRIKLEEEIFEYKGGYCIIKMDLSIFENIQKLYNEVLKITHKIDCLILNTGITNRESFWNTTYNEWNNVINTNLNIPFFIIQKFSNMIQEQGNIIFIGSLMGIIPHAISIPYAVSKAGIHMLAKSLVKVFKDKKVTVNAIAAGFINTDWHNSKNDVVKKRIENKIALQRFGETEEVAKACLCIINNQYINGAIINIDGGYEMGE